MESAWVTYFSIFLKNSIDTDYQWLAEWRSRYVRWASPPRAPPDPLLAGLTVSEGSFTQINR